MKKLITASIACALMVSAVAMPVSADEIYYPCYEGYWANYDSGNPVNLTITSINGNHMNFRFQYGQFAIDVNNAEINGTKVNGSYYESWEGGDFIVNGTVTLDLGDSGIWLDWHPYENGRDGGINGFMMRNSDFSYKIIQDSAIKVVLDGNEISFDQPPVMMNDRVLVPIRAIAEAMGAKVSWDEGVRKIGSVVGITKGSRYIGFCVEDTGYNENYNPFHMMIRDGDYDGWFITLDAPVIIYNDRTLVPVRAVSEAFNAQVDWDGNTQTVNIYTKAQKTNTASTEITPEKAKELAEQALRKKFADSDYGYEAYRIKYYVADYGTQYLVCGVTTNLANGEDRYMVNKTDGSLSYLGCASDWGINGDGTVTWCDGETAPPDGSKQVNKTIYEF